MEDIAMLLLEIGLIKDLYEKKIITEDEMNLAIIEINKLIEVEE